MFATLQDFQSAADKSQVPGALHLQYYTELADSKGLVLMRGEVDPERLTTTGATSLR